MVKASDLKEAYIFSQSFTNNCLPLSPADQIIPTLLFDWASAKLTQTAYDKQHTPGHRVLIDLYNWLTTMNFIPVFQ